MTFYRLMVLALLTTMALPAIVRTNRCINSDAPFGKCIAP